jgi:hypothetical protein
MNDDGPLSSNPPQDLCDKSNQLTWYTDIHIRQFSITLNVTAAVCLPLHLAPGCSPMVQDDERRQLEATTGQHPQRRTRPDRGLDALAARTLCDGITAVDGRQPRAAASAGRRTCSSDTPLFINTTSVRGADCRRSANMQHPPSRRRRQAERCVEPRLAGVGDDWPHFSRR